MKYQKGFTFFEVIISLFIISILATIGALSWMNFIQKQRIKIAAYQVMRRLSEAQLEAKRTRTSISVRFKTRDGIPQFSRHHPNDRENWKPFPDQLGVKPGQIEIFGQLDNLTITFNHIGAVSTPVPYTIKIAAPSRNADPSYRRCVVVWTLLGEKRIGSSFSECPTRKGATPAKGKIIWID